MIDWEYVTYLTCKSQDCYEVNREKFYIIKFYMKQIISTIEILALHAVAKNDII